MSHRSRAFADALVQACGDLGEDAQIISTGGGCLAVEVSYGSGRLLVADGDAGLPQGGPGTQVLIGDDPGTETETAQMVWLADPSADEVAAVVHHFLHVGSWQTPGIAADRLRMETLTR